MAADVRAALLVVDVQRDFCRGGALAVPDGDRVVPVLNRVIEDASYHGLLVYASRDWHPEVTMHFKKHGGLWPPHCVQGTEGARFHPDLRLPPSTVMMTKGDHPHIHGYSAFDGRTADGVWLADHLHARGVEHLYVGGLATDYCVRLSVLDARRAGMRVTVLQDAVAGIDVEPGDSERAFAEMREAGAEFTTSTEWAYADRALTAASSPRPPLP
jgi:nicotinamidase/pyrazinamidase